MAYNQRLVEERKQVLRSIIESNSFASKTEIVEHIRNNPEHDDLFSNVGDRSIRGYLLSLQGEGVSNIKRGYRKAGSKTAEEPKERFEGRCVGKAIRDEDGDITHYIYSVQIQDKPPLVGEFSRDEMDVVYRLYSSNDGANLNQRSVSREFPTITFRDFKRILRAFSITKDSIPVAPHVLEEMGSDDASELILKNKEDLVFKKLSQDREKHFEHLLRKAQKEILDMRVSGKIASEVIEEHIKDGDVAQYRIEKTKSKNNEMALNVYVSDWHIGARTKSDALYPNHYDAEVVKARAQKLLDEVMDLHTQFGKFDRVNVCNLGDSLDGMDGQTTRGGHGLPQNMSNKEQWTTFVTVMDGFIEALHKSAVSESIAYYSVPESNHGGDFEWTAQMGLKMFWSHKYPEMTCEIFDRFIGHFEYGVHKFVLTHGKDNHDMNRNMPIALNDKVELMLTEYIDFHNVQGSNIHVVKGDLHQSARQTAKRFSYKNVASMYGASAWIMANFGRGMAGTDYDIVSKNGPRILEGGVRFY